MRRVRSAPPNVRQILWKDIEEACVTNNSIGKGVFARCFAAHIGGLKSVCIKVLTAGDKYKSLFYSESKILSELCHFNLPWIHGLCCSSDHVAIVMTHHPYNGENASMHIHDALYKNSDRIKTDLNKHHWRQVLLGCSSALVYLKSKCILHNDIKSDNILIEKLPPQFSEVRAVLIDFNKACLCCEAQRYTLSSKEREYYAKHYPQIAPEVRIGHETQSFSSDIYSLGRVIKKINTEILDIPCICSLAELCLSSHSSNRPSAEELNLTFSNLFSM
jgi:serine/threonine protein kinase